MKENFNFTYFPTLKSERLTLRALNFNDIQAVFDLRSNDEINKLISRKTPENLEDAKEFINVCHSEFSKGNRIFWAIEFNEKVIGTIVYHSISSEKNYAEIGYELHPKYHQKSFMSEALKTVLDFGIKKMNLKIIEAFTHKNNMASIALLEKHNFVFQPNRKCNSVKENCIFKLKIN